MNSVHSDKRRHTAPPPPVHAAAVDTAPATLARSRTVETAVEGATALPSLPSPCPTAPWMRPYRPAERTAVLSRLLPWAPTAAARARALVRRSLSQADLPEEVIETAQLLVSELVANALRHGRPPLRLCVSSTDHDLHCCLADGSSSRPSRRRTTPTCEDGRGLALLEALSEQWGSYRLPKGKAVWFRLAFTGCSHG